MCVYCVCVCVSVCLYVCTYVCMYVCIYIWYVFTYVCTRGAGASARYSRAAATPKALRRCQVAEMCEAEK